jgi:hypothetical protein
VGWFFFVVAEAAEARSAVKLRMGDVEGVEPTSYSFRAEASPLRKYAGLDRPAIHVSRFHIAQSFILHDH